jgi:hypothetical protein
VTGGFRSVFPWFFLTTQAEENSPRPKPPNGEGLMQSRCPLLLVKQECVWVAGL